MAYLPWVNACALGMVDITPCEDVFPTYLYMYSPLHAQKCTNLLKLCLDIYVSCMWTPRGSS